MSMFAATLRGARRRERLGIGARDAAGRDAAGRDAAGRVGAGRDAVGPSAVRDALRPLKMATLGQLAAELAAPRREVEAALAFWEHRGSVRKARSLELSGCGGGCGSGCGSSKPASAKKRARKQKRSSTAGRKPAGIVALYEWVGD